jgi:hypothetical protein
MERELVAAPRKLAVKLMRAVVRFSSEQGREWASAMLEELDFIEGDWEALFWALGCTTAIFRYSSRSFWAWFGRQLGFKEEGMSNFQKWTVGVISGVGLTIAATAILMSLIHLSDHLFGFAELMPKIMIAMSGLAEVLFVGAAIALWRKRRPMAAGILFTAILLGTHFAMYISSHHLGR